MKVNNFLVSIHCSGNCGRNFNLFKFTIVGVFRFGSLYIVGNTGEMNDKRFISVLFNE